MSFDNPPFVIDATTVDGEVIRRAIGSLINPAGGIVTPGDLTVTQNGTPNMTVNIGLGQIWVPGSSTTTQGPYYSRNGGSISQAINSSDATNPRIDTIGVQVQDAAYAGALKQINQLYVAGTATAGANLTNLTGKGAVPASSYVLAYVLVPATATSIVTADISNVAAPFTVTGSLQVAVTGVSVTAAAGQRVIATASCTVALPPTPAVGVRVGILVSYAASGASQVTVARSGSATIYGSGLSAATSFPLGALGAQVELQFDGTNWAIVSGQQDSGWVIPTLASGFSPDANQPVRWRATGDRVNLEGIIQNTSGTTQGATTAMFTIPVPYRPAQNPKTFPFVSASGFLAPIIVNGNVEPQIAIGAGQQVFFNGLSYSIT